MCPCYCSLCREEERGRVEKGPKLINLEILKNLETKLSHLTPTEKMEMGQLLKEFQQVLGSALLVCAMILMWEKQAQSKNTPIGSIQ